MINKNKILESIYCAVDEIKETIDVEGLEKSEKTTLFGENGTLDSIGLVNFINTTEQQIEEDLKLL